MLLGAKIADLRRQLAYSRSELGSHKGDAPASRAERLNVYIQACDHVDSLLVDLAAVVASYDPTTDPAMSTWRQIITRVREVASFVQDVRVQEVPAHQAVTPDDDYASTLMDATLSEAGLTDVHPIASLHQGHWVATRAVPPLFPLLFFPCSIVSDPAEISLVFHEAGHVLFRLWHPNLAEQAQIVVNAAVRRKESEAASSADPAVRQDQQEALREWVPVAERELEELVCDVVGSLLGGSSFVIALALGLMTNTVDPFVTYADAYPPMAVRMRIGHIALAHLGITHPALDTVRSGWQQIATLHQTSRPRFHDWLYDDQYLGDLTAAISAYLQGQGLQLYDGQAIGLRGSMDEGSILRLEDPGEYDTWAQQTAVTWRKRYGP